MSVHDWISGARESRQKPHRLTSFRPFGCPLRALVGSGRRSRPTQKSDKFDKPTAPRPTQAKAPNPNGQAEPNRRRGREGTAPNSRRIKAGARARAQPLRRLSAEPRLAPLIPRRSLKPARPVDRRRPAPRIEECDGESASAAHSAQPTPRRRRRMPPEQNSKLAKNLSASPLLILQPNERTEAKRRRKVRFLRKWQFQKWHSRKSPAKIAKMVNSWGERTDEGHSRPRHEHFRDEKNETRRCESDHPAVDARLGHKRRRQPRKREPAIRLGASRMRLGALVEQTLGRQKRSECSIRSAAQSKMRRCATHDMKSKGGRGEVAPPAANRPMRAKAHAPNGSSVRRGYRFPNLRRRKRAVTMAGGELEGAAASIPFRLHGLLAAGLRLAQEGPETGPSIVL